MSQSISKMKAKADTSGDTSNKSVQIFINIDNNMEATENSRTSEVNERIIPLNLKRSHQTVTQSGCKKRKQYHPKQRNPNQSNEINRQDEAELIEIFAEELKNKLIGSVIHVLDDLLKQFVDNFKNNNSNQCNNKAVSLVNTPEICKTIDGYHQYLDFDMNSTSVAVPNPSLNESEVLVPNFKEDSPDYSDEKYSSIMQLQYSATKVVDEKCMHKSHLRKAKLMFFWVRYPSSAVLKMYFPDIKFNKNNTAQLVKWFSNFREFYYKNIETYARKLMSDSNSNYKFNRDSELYKTFQLHYNCNNDIEMPPGFYIVVEVTILEFIKAIQSGKDSVQSWKKAIYKIISKHDEKVPEYFITRNF